MDIHRTKKQTENTFSLCCFLFLKTLFHFIVQCIQYSILKATCVDQDKTGQLKLYIFLTHLPYRANAKKSVIYQTIIHSFEIARKERAS